VLRKLKSFDVSYHHTALDNAISEAISDMPVFKINKNGEEYLRSGASLLSFSLLENGKFKDFSFYYSKNGNSFSIVLVDGVERYNSSFDSSSKRELEKLYEYFSHLLQRRSADVTIH
jgi:hypothetical protein